MCCLLYLIYLKVSFGRLAHVWVSCLTCLFCVFYWSLALCLIFEEGSFLIPWLSLMSSSFHFLGRFVGCLLEVLSWFLLLCYSWVFLSSVLEWFLRWLLVLLCVLDAVSLFVSTVVQTAPLLLMCWLFSCVPCLLFICMLFC